MDQNENSLLAFQVSKEQLRSLIESAPVAIAIARNGLMLYPNPCFIKMFGFSSAEELVGQSLDERISPQSHADSAQRRAAGLPVATTYESIGLRKDGSQFPLHIAVTQIELTDGPAFAAFYTDLTEVISFGIDITERRNTEAQRARRVIELETIYDSGLALARLLAPEEIGQKILEILSNKLQWHHAVVRSFHAEKNEIKILALNPMNADQNEAQKEINRLDKAISRPGDGLTGWVLEYGQSILSNDLSREVRYFKSYPEINSGMYVPMRTGQTIVGCITVESDRKNMFDEHDLRLLETVANQAAIAIENARLYQTTQSELAERRRIEQELQMLNEQLERHVADRTIELSTVNIELEHALRLKDEFLASMSHELRTPLSGVLNLSEILQEQLFGPLNPKQTQLISTIEESGRHLLGLINDILDLSKIEAGQLELDIERCQMQDICQSSLQMVKGLAQKKQQHLTYTSNPAMIELKADPRRLKQILVNLLSNAVKFTPEGGSIGLQVEAEPADKIVHVTVWDTGIGIAADQMPRLFKPFIQLDSKLSRQHDGTGLGLALVLRMTEMHNGSISVKSTPGEGSRFIITLPWHDCAAGESGTRPHLSVSTVPVDRTNQPGEIIGGRNLVDYLSAQGIIGDICERADQAIELLHNTQPDLILLDSQLTGGSAWELMNQLKNNAATQAIPVIVTSIANERARANEQGAAGYLARPYTMKALRDELDLFIPQPRRVLLIGPVSDSPVILLVDDHEINLRTYSDYLKAKGYQVLKASNGAEGVRVALNLHPHLVLMDIQMPGMDGLEATRQIRQSADRTTAAIPIIALTALAMPGDFERCIAAGVNDYLSKPVALLQLHKMIASHLDKKTP